MRRLFAVILVFVALINTANAAEIPEEFTDLFDCYSLNEWVELPSGNEVIVRDAVYCSYAEFIGVEDPEEKYPPYYVAIEVEYKNNSNEVVHGKDIFCDTDLVVYAWPEYGWSGWLIWKDEFYTEYEEGYILPIEMTVEYIFRMTDEYNAKRVQSSYSEWEMQTSLTEVEIQPGESVVYIDLVNIVSPEEIHSALYPLAYSIREAGISYNIRLNCLDVQYIGDGTTVDSETIDKHGRALEEIGLLDRFEDENPTNWGYDQQRNSDAIREFQEAHQLPVTGDMDELTLAILWTEAYLD